MPNLSSILTKKTTIQLVVGLVIIVCVGLALNSLAPQEPTYEYFLGSRYSLNYPTGWNLDQIQGAQDVVITRAKNSKQPSIEVKVLDAYKDLLSVESYSNDFLDNAEKNLNGFTLGNLDTLTVMDVPATKIEYEYVDEQSQVLKSMQVDVLSNYLVYRLNFTSYGTEYDKYLPVFSRLLENFRIY